MRIPILFDMAEVERLSGIAHTAAIQTGAKGHELDQVMDRIFVALVGQTNRATIKVTRRPPLRLVKA